MGDYKNSEKLQAVINTLKLLEMPPTYENVDRMTGIYKILCEVRDGIYEAEVEADGEDQAE